MLCLVIRCHQSGGRKASGGHIEQRQGYLTRHCPHQDHKVPGIDQTIRLIQGCNISGESLLLGGLQLIKNESLHYHDIADIEFAIRLIERGEITCLN